MAETKNCIVCNKQFTTNRAQQICCSKKCADIRHRMLMRERYNPKYAQKKRQEKIVYKKECVICNKIFETLTPQKITCSPECRAERDRAMRRIYQRNKRSEKRETKKQRKSMSELARIVELARQHKVSYGVYVGIYEQTGGER